MNQIATRTPKKDLVSALVWATGMIAVALGAKVAGTHGYIDGDTATRMVTCMTGLWLVWFGNRMPKAFAPSDCARRVKRVGGWVTVVSGLAYAGLWAFAPIPVAIWGGSGAVLLGVAVTLGFCLSQRAKLTD